MLRKLILIFGLGLMLLAGCARDGESGALIEQAVGYLNTQEPGKWADLWVPENRESIRRALLAQPEDEGLKNVKSAKLIRRVDVTGKVPINPNYPFVAVRAYYLELELDVKKEQPEFKNGRNHHFVMVLQKTPKGPWGIRHWGASPPIEELVKPRQMEPPKQPPQPQPEAPGK